MIDITLRCNVNKGAGIVVTPDNEDHLCFESFNGRGDGWCLWFSPADTRRLYDALGAHLGITPTESDALTRIAVALEALAPVADALTKLASFATDDPLAESARIP